MKVKVKILDDRIGNEIPMPSYGNEGGFGHTGKN